MPGRYRKKNNSGTHGSTSSCNSQKLTLQDPTNGPNNKKPEERTPSEEVNLKQDKEGI